MAQKNTCSRFTLLKALWFIALLLFMFGCTDSHHQTSGSVEDDTGTLNLSLTWGHPVNSRVKVSPDGSVCTDYDIVTIEAVLQDQDDNVVSRGKWYCSERHGNLTEIPAGSGMKLTITGITQTGDSGWLGEADNIHVTASDDTRVSVVMHYHGDDIRPEIIARHTPIGAVDISLFASFRFEFSEAVTHGSINEQWITLFETDDPQTTLPITFSYDPETRIVKIAPEDAQTLRPNTAYTMSFSHEIEDIHGLTMEKDYNYPFTTISEEFHGITTLENLFPGNDFSAMAITESTIFISFFTQLGESSTSLMVARSYNEGADWDIRPINHTFSSPGRLSMAADGSHVFICGNFENSSRTGVLKSGDNGDSWSLFINNDLVRANGFQDQMASTVTFDGQQIYFAYGEMKDFNSVSLAVETCSYQGTDWSFTSAEAPSSGISQFLGMFPSAQFVNNTLYISNTGRETDALYLTTLSRGAQDPVSTMVDTSMTWSFDTALSVQQRVEGTHIYIAHVTEENGRGYLKFSRSVDNGAHFSNQIVDEDISGTYATMCFYPSIAVSGDGVFISYYDAFEGSLKFARSEDQGLTWQTATIDNTAEVVGTHTSIAAMENRIFISYCDSTNTTVKFAKSLDRGRTWE